VNNPNQNFSNQSQMGYPTPGQIRQTDTLSAEQGLQRNERITSRNGRFEAILQADSNFVVYDSGRPVWATNTVGVPGNLHLCLHSDGNLVIWNPPVPGMSQNLVWESRSMGRAQNPTLVM
jgi:hypothetical protein